MKTWLDPHGFCAVDKNNLEAEKVLEKKVL
jgi:hypothetical protein